MEERILVAGCDVHQVSSMRRRWGHLDYASIPCGTITALLEELEVLPTCGVRVLMVVMYPDILQEPCEALMDRLSGCALDVPFVLDQDGELDKEGMRSREIFQRLCKHRIKFDPNKHPFSAVPEKANVKAVTE